MRELLLKLLYAKKEEDVDKILKEEPIFTNSINWRPLLNIENNKGQIESQGINPIKALVEKITNSIDAILLRKCLEYNIDPASNLAPKSIKAALKKFFNIDESFIYLTRDSIDRLASQIYLIIENLRNKKGNVYIIDQGEGQDPENFEKTFLGSGGNKVNIFFTHGRFGIGSFGVLPNAGENGFQIILSKKFNGKYWGWTIIRKFFREGYKHSRYEYFKPENNIAQFKEEDLIDYIRKIILYEKIDIKNFKSGTLIKLFDYDLPKITSVDRDLNRELNRYLCEPALPYRILNIDIEGDVKGKVGPGKEVKGNINRLVEWKNQGLVEYTSLETELPYLGYIKIKFYLGKKREGMKETIIETEKVTTREASVFFIFNGQTHAEFDRYFLEDDLSLNYIHKDLAILVDCSHLENEIFDKLFSPTRELIRAKSAMYEIRSELAKILNKFQWLKDKDQERKKEVIESKISKDKNWQEIIMDLLSKDPNLVKLLSGEILIQDINKIERGGKKNKEKFIGRLIPTYLNCIDKEILKTGIKKIPINSYVKVVFETDAQNDYFDRKYNSGKLLFYSKNNLIKLKTNTSPINGRLTLFFEVFSKNKTDIVGLVDEVEIEITRPPHPNFNPDNKSLIFKFKIEIIGEIETKNNPTGKIKPSLLANIKVPNFVLVNANQMDNENDICKVETTKLDNGDIVLTRILVNKDYLPLKKYFLTQNLKESTKDKFERIFYIAVWLNTIIIFKQQTQKGEFKKEKMIEILNYLGESLIYTLFSLKEKYFLNKEQ